MTTPYVAINSVLVYLANCSPWEVFSKLFPESEPIYISEWVRRHADRGAGGVWGHLDAGKRRLLIEHALERYASESHEQELIEDNFLRNQRSSG
jgi:hypothetical protein